MGVSVSVDFKRVSRMAEIGSVRCGRRDKEDIGTGTGGNGSMNYSFCQLLIRY